MNIHEPFELGVNLIDHLRRARCHDRDPADRPVFRDIGDGQTLDIVAACGEHAGDAGEHAGFIVHRDGQRMPLLGPLTDMHQTRAFASSSISPVT